jgi:hypothetical protein
MALVYAGVDNDITWHPVHPLVLRCVMKFVRVQLYKLYMSNIDESPKIGSMTLVMGRLDVEWMKDRDFYKRDKHINKE